MTSNKAPRQLRWLGALLVIYLAYPFAELIYRVSTGHNEGWNSPGLWSALGISVEGATISVAIGVLTGIPLAYILARHRGWLSTVIGVIVQLPLAVPPLISGILLIYIVGPYSFLGQISGQRLTETMYGLVISQSFVSAPFLIVVARSAFRAVDPSLDDVAATLGHGPMSRFLRVAVPAAGDGLRTGMILMWLRAFGEYGTTVILAYHPYSLPVYVDNLFSSVPLSEAEAPTVLALAVAVVAIVLSHVRRRSRGPRRALPAPLAPLTTPSTPVGFNIDVTVGTFQLRVAHAEGSHRLAIVGPSGSGKSVTLRTLAGLLGSSAGTVTYGGVDVSHSAPEHRHLGYVPQGLGLFPGRTVWQQVNFGVGADPGLAAWWLRTLHLDELSNRSPDQLSGGQRQRVSLARALATSPHIVLLDEPFSALDAPVRAELRRELRRLQREANLSTILVTHDPEEAAMLADEVMIVHDGKVLQAGSVREVFARPASVTIGRLLGIDNLFEGVLSTTGVVLNTPSSTVNVPGGLSTDVRVGTDVLWHVAPTALRVRAQHLEQNVNPPSIRIGEGRITDIVELGRSYEIVVELSPNVELRARSLETSGLSVGAACSLEADEESVLSWATPTTPSDSAS